MFYKMIENKCTQWYESERCTVKNLIEYIEKTGQMSMINGQSSRISSNAQLILPERNK